MIYQKEMKKVLKAFRGKKIKIFSKRFLFGLEWSLGKKDKGVIGLKRKRQLFPLINFCLENLSFQVYNIYLAKYWSGTDFSSGKGG